MGNEQFKLTSHNKHRRVQIGKLSISWRFFSMLIMFIFFTIGPLPGLFFFFSVLFLFFSSFFLSFLLSFLSYLLACFIPSSFPSSLNIEQAGEMGDQTGASLDTSLMSNKGNKQMILIWEIRWWKKIWGCLVDQRLPTRMEFSPLLENGKEENLTATKPVVLATLNICLINRKWYSTVYIFLQPEVLSKS